MNELMYIMYVYNVLLTLHSSASLICLQLMRDVEPLGTSSLQYLN